MHQQSKLKLRFHSTDLEKMELGTSAPEPSEDKFSSSDGSSESRGLLTGNEDAVTKKEKGHSWLSMSRWI